MQIGAIESTWKRRAMIILSFPVVVSQDMYRAAKYTVFLARLAWQKREVIITPAPEPVHEEQA